MAKEITKTVKKPTVKIPRAKIAQIMTKYNNASRYRHVDLSTYLDQIVTAIKEANKK